MLVPFEVFVEIHVVAVHFFYEQREFSDRLVLGENIEVFALVIEIEEAGINFRNQRIQILIADRERVRLAVSCSRVVQALVIDPDFAFADDKARFVIAYEFVFVQIPDLAFVFKIIVGIFTDFFNDIHTLLLHPVERGSGDYGVFVGVELIIIVHRRAVTAI